jgi:GTP cyclohydrolase I
VQRVKTETHNGKQKAASSLPDITVGGVTPTMSPLDWVGMEQVDWPVRLSFEGRPFLTSAKVDCFVSLDDPKAKGIHMSRLYQLLWSYYEKDGVFEFKALEQLLRQLIESQQGLSSSAKLKIELQWPALRKSLKSEIVGFRSYPMTFSLTLTPEGLTAEVEGQVQYSSTCPCSAALARQLNQEHFMTKFGSQKSVSTEVVGEWLGTEESVAATPHAQRSLLEYRVVVTKDFAADHALMLVDRLESALKTPVQTAVKRVDEQEFARLNAENLMFCEDAARVVKAAFDAEPLVRGYWVKVSHLESLHPHNAVAVLSNIK